MKKTALALTLLLMFVNNLLAIQSVRASVESVETSCAIFVDNLVEEQPINITVQIFPAPPEGETFDLFVFVTSPLQGTVGNYPWGTGPWAKSLSSDTNGKATVTFDVHSFSGYWSVELVFEGQYFANNTIYYEEGNWQRNFYISPAQTLTPSPTTSTIPITTVTIEADGSIEGTDKIQTDGNVYTFTENLFSPIVVERNNIVIDGQGFTLQGLRITDSVAMNLTCSNVTVANFHISGWEKGILGVFDNNTIANNNFTDNHHDIAVYANNYRIIGNNLGPERIAGNDNIISKNQIVLGDYDTGFWITNSSGTIIESNNITLSKLTTFFISTDNGNFEVFHNNFLNIEEHTGGYLLFLFAYPPVNATPPYYWDNGIEGNYWSDYSARYSTSSEIDNSGIGNIHYVSRTSSKVIDRYPLVAPYNLTKTVVPTQPSISPSPTSPASFSPDLSLMIVSVAVSVTVVCIVSLVYFKKLRR